MSHPCSDVVEPLELHVPGLVGEDVDHPDGGTYCSWVGSFLDLLRYIEVYKRNKLK